ncbi:hypothetical protein ACHAXT_005504 [Thalassiosira profunda]
MLLAGIAAVSLVCTCSAAADFPSASLVHRRHNQQQRRRAQANLDGAGALGGGQLSVDDQLDILKLGFMPASKPPKGELDHRKDLAHISRGGSVEEDQPRSFLPAVLAFLGSLFRGGSSNGISVEDGGEPRVYFPPLAFASTMAFLAGYSDVICVRQFNCYAAMMSGNVVVTSMALAEKKWTEALGRLSLIGSYLLGAASVRSIELIHRRSAESETKSNQHLTMVAPIVAVIFAIANHLVMGLHSDSQKWKLALLAFGYGMVYASANQALNATITQLLTGHIVKLGTAVSDRFVGTTRQWNAGSLLSLCILGSFIAGGACGTLSLPSVPKDFPFFTVLGIGYALVLSFYGDTNSTHWPIYLGVCAWLCGWVHLML